MTGIGRAKQPIICVLRLLGKKHIASPGLKSVSCWTKRNDVRRRKKMWRQVVETREVLWRECSVKVPGMMGKADVKKVMPYQDAMK